MRRHAPQRSGVVVDRQPIPQEERVRIGCTDRSFGQGVIMLGDHAGPFAHNADPGAAGFHSRPLRRGEELIPRSDPFRRLEIGGKAVPVTFVVASQQLDPALLGRCTRRFRRIEDEQRPRPPSNLVVGEITDPVRGVAIGGDELAGERVHPGRGLGRERVEPVKARAAPEFEVDDRGELEHLRRQRPATGAVEPPREEPVAGLCGPILERRGEGFPTVAGISLADLRVIGTAAAWECGRDCSRKESREAARSGALHALVPPTVSPSIRNVGWPTPTGTPCPSFPHVPIPSSRRRSLPIIVTLVMASGPLPINVAPLTAGPTLPSSIRYASDAENTNLPEVMST